MAMTADYFKPTLGSRQFGLPADEPSPFQYPQHPQQLQVMAQSSHLGMGGHTMFHDSHLHAFEAAPPLSDEGYTSGFKSVNSSAAIPQSGRSQRRSSSSGTTTQTMDSTEPKAKAPRRSRRESATSKDSSKTHKQRQQEVVAEDEDKRQLHLKRNRKAAERCREKRRRHEEELQSLVHALEMNNAKLRSDATSLQNEMIGLKTECLKHFECNCSGIRNYLVDNAKTSASASTGHMSPSSFGGGSDMFPDAMGGYLYSH